MKQNENLLLKDAFKSFINATESGKRKMASGKKISAGVVENYRYVLKHLENYESKTGNAVRIIPMQKVTSSLLKSEQRYWNKFFEGFSKYLYHDMGHFDNFVSNTFKTIKTLFNWLKFEKATPVGDFHKLFKVPVQQQTPQVVMPEQLNYLIFNVDFNNQLPLHLQRTKDIFVFGCTTGLRVSDLMQLKQKHLIVNSGITYLTLYTQKTSTSVVIPLPNYCIEIIRKYKRKCEGYLLPRLSNTNLNLQLKELGKCANWTHSVPKYRTRKGKLVELKNENGSCWKFYQHLTTHSMRRTAITSLLMMGVDEAVVRRLSGHTPGSKEFYRYVALAQSYVDQQIQVAHQRLAATPTWYQNKQ